MKNTVKDPLRRLLNCRLERRRLMLSLKENVGERAEFLLGHLKSLLSGTEPGELHVLLNSSVFSTL